MEHEAAGIETASGLPSAAAISSESTQQDSNELIGDFNIDIVSGCQTQPQTEGIAAQTTQLSVEMASKENQITLNKMETNKIEPDEGFCNIKLDSLIRLKDSTKKLLCLIDELQVRSCPSRPIPTAYHEDDMTIPLLNQLTVHLDDLPETSSIAHLETQIKEIDKAGIENMHECSIYERLIRKCNCLNRKEYNDFTIHFNEETKYTTSDLGEIIKNIRILKKFLYMGGGYSKNALMFLNEGLTKCPHTEKVDIIMACSHADLCNVFDDDSFVKILIKGPIQYENFGDLMTQSLAARVLYKIAIIEEGRRYLNFNSKIPNDIKLLLRIRSGHLKDDTKTFLNSTLSLLNPTNVPLINATYYCKADEGMAMKILNALSHFRLFMTLEEILINLELLNKLCDSDKGKRDMREHLKTTCMLFKRLLLEYDNSNMNVIVTSILNKLMRKPQTENNVCLNIPKTYVVSDTATEPTEMKHQVNQAPSVFSNFKKKVKSKLGIHVKTHQRKSAKKFTSRQDIEESRTSNKSKNNPFKKDMDQSRINNKSNISTNYLRQEKYRSNNNNFSNMSGFCTGPLQKELKNCLMAKEITQN